MACFSAMPPPARRGPGRSGWRAARAAAGWWGQANRSRPGPSDTAARHPAGRPQAGVRLPAPLIRRQRFRILQLGENLDMTFSQLRQPVCAHDQGQPAPPGSGRLPPYARLKPSIRCLANILWGASFASHRMRGSQMIDLIQVARVRGGSPALTPAGPYARSEKARMASYPHSSTRAPAPCLQAVGWPCRARHAPQIQCGRHGVSQCSLIGPACSADRHSLPVSSHS